ncbi:MAG TPA: hypothetical protein PLF26_18230, partial [Blastocatellia bacterium]|nr:hypothetical protein [Blastocatellia bacterium]
MPSSKPLHCPRCGAFALLSAQTCSTCGLRLDWDAIADLTSLDYLLRRLEQWRRQGVLDEQTFERTSTEARANQAKLQEMLESPPARVPRGSDEGPPLPRIQPPAPEPPSFHAGPAAGDPRPPGPAEPPGRSWLDVLVDIGTVRLMLYAGALLLAVGVMIWLRDTLRVELQKPTTQAGLLAVFTLSVLGGGAALVARARDRVEMRVIGRGALFLGTLLLPLNPWFWLRSGLIEDRGNAWIVGFVTFAVALTIALGLGDRVFVYLAYAAAVLTGWLLTFKLTGGASPGLYALSIVGVSLAFLHAEWPAESERAPARWRGLGASFLICGHIGIAFALVFYTTFLRLVPPEVYAAFRHFDASGYSSSIGIVVAIATGYANLYSAARRRLQYFMYAGMVALFWATALLLADRQAPDGVWLTACGAWALATIVAARALQSRPLWGAPLTACAKALAWTGFVSVGGVALAYTVGDVDVRWFTALGALLVALAFAFDVARMRRELEACAATLVLLLLAGWLLRKTGLEWIHVDALLALLAGITPWFFGAATQRFKDAIGTAHVGVTIASIAVALALTLPCIGFAVDLVGVEVARDIPLALALTVSLVLAGWPREGRIRRTAVFAVAGLMFGLALHLAAMTVESRYEVSSRFAVFLYTPSPYLLLVLWLLLRKRASDRLDELAGVTRAVAAIATGVAAILALPIVMDAALTSRGAFLFAGALGLLMVVPLAVALVEKDAPVAHFEGSFAAILLSIAWFSAVIGIGRQVKGYEGLVLWICYGAVPLIYAAVARGLRDLFPAVTRPLSIVGIAIAGLLHLALLPILSPSFATGISFTVSNRIAFILLAALLTWHGLYRTTDDRPIVWRIVWSLQAAVAATFGIYGVAHSNTVTNPASVFVLVVTLAGALAIGRRVDERVREFLVLLAHSCFVFAVSLALMHLSTRLELSNPELTRSVAELGALTVAAWVVARAHTRTELL